MYKEKKVYIIEKGASIFGAALISGNMNLLDFLIIKLKDGREYNTLHLLLPVMPACVRANVYGGAEQQQRREEEYTARHSTAAKLMKSHSV